MTFSAAEIPENRFETVASSLVSKGIFQSEEDARSVLAGIAAAPETVDDAWLGLVGGDQVSDLKDDLVQLFHSLRTQQGSPFSAGPAPKERIDGVREEMKAQGLDAFIVPRSDEFLGEYVPARGERLYWLTGFAGSAGTAIVGLEQAAIFVDGRYTVQVTEQVDPAVFEICPIAEITPSDWLEKTARKGWKIGVDTWLLPKHSVDRIRNAAGKVGATVVSVDSNPVDAVWRDQPPPPLGPVGPHSLDYAGVASSEKRSGIAKSLKDKGADAAVITATDSIAWLLNVRGTDVPRCPLPLSFAIVRDDETVDWFVDDRKLLLSVRQHLDNAVAVQPFSGFEDGLAALGGQSVLVDPAGSPAAVFEKLKEAGANIIESDDPCLLPKALKNPVELDGTRAAHIRDGAAVSRFLSWLPSAAKKGLTELEAAAKLKSFRFVDDRIRDLSFDTISAAGPNGALPHYRVSKESDRKLEEGQLYLVDSGGQYLDGTTDITRTIAIGKPSDEMRDRFTRVLKGHIAIARVKFPDGVTGTQIDALARQHLWEVGLDFDHGTGHGVGSYLNVHEGPQRISKGAPSAVLKPGMILSNEPGFYKVGEFGIRIENLVVVRDLGEAVDGVRRLYGFETITFAPIDTSLIDVSMLTAGEIAWFNAYHEEVREKIAPLLDGSDLADLVEATRPIG